MLEYQFGIPGWEKQVAAMDQTLSAMNDGYAEAFKSQRMVDKLLVTIRYLTSGFCSNKQWYLEMYKLGAATGNGAPPISLQAVWTADNGKLPPWKGDFHHDLNTQLSYWPAYSSNHMIQESGYITGWKKTNLNLKNIQNSISGFRTECSGSHNSHRTANGRMDPVFLRSYCLCLARTSFLPPLAIYNGQGIS